MARAMSPRTLSLPVMKAMVGSSVPVASPTKSSPDIEMVVLGLSGAPAPASPAPSLSTMWYEPPSSPLSSNWYAALVVPTFAGSASRRLTSSKISLTVVTDGILLASDVLSQQSLGISEQGLELLGPRRPRPGGALRGVGLIARRVLDQGDDPGGHEAPRAYRLPATGHLADLYHAAGGADFDLAAGAGGRDLVCLRRPAGVDDDLDPVTLHVRDRTLIAVRARRQARSARFGGTSGGLHCDQDGVVALLGG